MKFNPKNPRKSTHAKRAILKKQLEEFGDLGGIVFNRRTGVLVGGHQRCSQFAGIEPTIVERFDTPRKSGTTAEGFIEFGGERFSYREVDWPKEKETMAMIAANNHAGEWDERILRELTAEIKASGGDMAMTGLADLELSLADENDEPVFQNDETDDVPNEREVYIVPIALTRKQWDQWEKAKEKVGLKKCKTAFLKIVGIEP